MIIEMPEPSLLLKKHGNSMQHRLGSAWIIILDDLPKKTFRWG